MNLMDKIFPRSCLSLLVFVPEVIKVLIINLKKEFNQGDFLDLIFHQVIIQQSSLHYR